VTVAGFSATNGDLRFDVRVREVLDGGDREARARIEVLDAVGRVAIVPLLIGAAK
jgi:hypothetical protein